MTQHGKWRAIFGADPRKLKRFERRHFSPVYDAWTLGEFHADRGKMTRNFPPGRRRDEYERAFRLADPLGDHHGRNV